LDRLRAQLAEVLRENHLLKRAVAIQNTRMQELRWVVAVMLRLISACRQV
jgi:hypothetical protein